MQRLRRDHTPQALDAVNHAVIATTPRNIPNPAIHHTRHRNHLRRNVSQRINQLRSRRRSNITAVTQANLRNLRQIRRTAIHQLGTQLSSNSRHIHPNRRKKRTRHTQNTRTKTEPRPSPHLNSSTRNPLQTRRRTVKTQTHPKTKRPAEIPLTSQDSHTRKFRSIISVHRPNNMVPTNTHNSPTPRNKRFRQLQMRTRHRPKQSRLLLRPQAENSNLSTNNSKRIISLRRTVRSARISHRSTIRTVARTQFSPASRTNTATMQRSHNISHIDPLRRISRVNLTYKENSRVKRIIMSTTRNTSSIRMTTTMHIPHAYR